jgi:ATP-binding cassette, subfamily B, bacterial PglK
LKLKTSFFRKIRLILSSREQRKGLTLLFLMIVAMILETASIGIIIPFMQVISDPEALSANGLVLTSFNYLNLNKESLIVFSASALFLVFLMKNIFLSFIAWYRIRFMANLRMNLSNRLFDLYLFQPYTFHLQHNSGQLIQNISNEVPIFTGRLLTPLAHLIGEILVLIGIILLLFIIEPLGTFIIAAVLGSVSILIIFYTRNYVAIWGTERQFHDGKRIQHLQQGLGGIKDVMFLGREFYFFNKYKTHSKSSTVPDIKQTFLQEIPRFWFEMLAISGIGIMIIMASIRGSEISTILSTLAVFAAAAFRLMPSVTRILAAVQSLRYSMPILDVLHDVFSSEDLVNSESVTNKYSEGVDSEFSDSVALKNVTYKYPNSKNPSLLNVSIEIKIGECIGIIGASGSGKSTLVDVLLGLLSPDEGMVIVDGKNINLNRREWQTQIGYVPQSIFLTDDSLRANIAFGISNDEIDDKLIDNAIDLAQLKDLVRSLPEGLETFVGERGVRLSGGQRQRIGIARALYFNPKIIVFDEATSSLDNDTENQIMKTVHSLHKDKTIIIIAHRLSTVKDCNRLYKLALGKIVEEGASKDLLI